MTELVPRLAAHRLHELMGALRVVVVNGPRQAGKTTLLRSCHRDLGGEFRTLDDPDTVATAREDPMSFVQAAERPLVIDEVQRGGDPLVRAVKIAVDEDTSRGQFVLSGSTNFLTVPTLSESLAGRAGFVELWPFCVAERAGDDGGFCDQLFDDPRSLLRRSPWTRDEYIDLVCLGGYPEVLEIDSEVGRRGWFDGYLATVVARDVAGFAQVHRTQAVPDILALAAARSGSPFVAADVARALEMSAVTVRNYVAYLETVYLLTTVPAWSTNLASKVTKAAKLYLTDSGLACHLLGADRDALRRPGHPALGPLVETFVLAELRKLLGWTDTALTVRHFRDRDGREVDVVLEARDGRVAAVEAKASASAGADAARHLHWLRDRLGDRFVAGVVFHLGQTAGSLGDRVLTLPLSALWGHARLPGRAAGDGYRTDGTPWSRAPSLW
ncbi:MAG: ATP-binding protein [Streptosporangiaceae bacterium]